MFINLTNHPSANWSEEQLSAARQYGEITDLQFPVVDENASEAEIMRLADDYLNMILSKGNANEITVHIMGEQTLCYALISRLQKKGIRCVASCTKRDTHVNEAGERISTFRFTRFREYTSPTAYALKRWWTGLKDRCEAFFGKWAFLHNKKFHSSLALIIVLLCELLMMLCLQLDRPILCCIAIIAAIPLLTLSVIRTFCKHRLSIYRLIVTKLLANAVTPSTLGTSYLFIFVIHIGWLTNAVLGLYTAGDDTICQVLTSTIVCLIGIFILIAFFPKGNEQKEDSAQKVFISGISSISTKNDWNKITYDTLNLLPLVRILQLAKADTEPPKMVILQTDAFKDTEEYNKIFRHVLELINSEACPLLDQCRGVNDRLELLIRETAKREFPEMANRKGPDHVSFIDKISIEFTEACNYSKNFERAYSIIEERTKELDDVHHCLYFNLTPGTAMIGSLMTLMAIDGDRHLYYYGQEPMPDLDSEEEKRRFRENLVLPVDKSQIPLQALLSQALEKQN